MTLTVILQHARRGAAKVNFHPESDSRAFCAWKILFPRKHKKRELLAKTEGPETKIKPKAYSSF